MGRLVENKEVLGLERGPLLVPASWISENRNGRESQRFGWEHLGSVLHKWWTDRRQRSKWRVWGVAWLQVSENDLYWCIVRLLRCRNELECFWRERMRSWDAKKDGQQMKKKTSYRLGTTCGYDEWWQMFYFWVNCPFKVLYRTFSS